MNKRILTVAMESTTEIIEIPDEFSVDHAAINVEDASQRILQGMDEIDRANQVVVALESLSDEILNNIMDNDAGGTMSPHEQRLVDVTLDQIYLGSGIEKPELSMESFGSFVSAVKEQILKIIEMILAGLKKLYEWIRGFIGKMNSEGRALAGQNRQLDAEIKMINPNVEPKIKTIKNEFFANRLKLQEHHQSLADAYNEVLDFVEKATEVFNNPVVENVAESIKSFGTPGAKHPDFAKLITDAYRPAFSHINTNLPYPRKMLDAPEDSSDVYETNIMLEGVVGVAIIPKNNESLRVFKLGMINVEKETSTAKEIQILSLVDARRILTSAQSVHKFITEFDKNKDVIAAIESDVERLRSRLKNITGELTDADRAVLRDIATVVGPTLINGLHTKAFAYAFRVTQHVQNFCKICLSQYEKKK